MSQPDTSYDDEAAPAEETTVAEGRDAASDLEAARRASAEGAADAADAADADAGDDPFADVELEDDGMPAAEALYDAMRAVIDPEIGYNVVDLGLVYDVSKVEDGGVHVRMTLTTMGCPLTELIHQQASMVLTALPGVEHVDVEFTFSPPWSPDMMEDYVKEELRAMGMQV